MTESLQELYEKYGIGNEKAELTEEEYDLGIDVESIINDVVGSRGDNYEPVSEMETTRILDDIFRNDTVIPDTETSEPAVELHHRTETKPKKKPTAKKKRLLDDPYIKEIAQSIPDIKEVIQSADEEFEKDEFFEEEKADESLEIFEEVEIFEEPVTTDEPIEITEETTYYEELNRKLPRKIASLPKNAKAIILTSIATVILVVALYFIATVKIIIMENSEKSKTLIAVGSNYEEIVDKATPELSEGRTVITKQGRRVTLNVITPFEITVNDGDSISIETTTGGTVSEVLNELAITLNKDDIVSPEIDEVIDKPTTLTITRIEYKKATETESYEAPVDDQSEGATKTVTRPGVTGVALVTYMDRYENGKRVSRAEMSRSIVTEAQAAVILSLEHNGEIPVMTEAPTEYVAIYNIECTAYSEPGNYTATGKLAMVGYVAVDPTVIPYGTKMFICSADGSYVYGYAQAEDCGGAVKGNIVDLYMDTEEECIQFGRRPMIAYILE